MYYPLWLEESFIDDAFREDLFINFRKEKKVDLKQLTDQELELLIYEYKNERCDHRMYMKLLDERNRRNKE